MWKNLQQKNKLLLAELGESARSFVLVFLIMNGIHEALDDFRLTRVLTLILADFASVVVEAPTLGDFGCHQFDDDIHGLHTLEIISEMCADTE